MYKENKIDFLFIINYKKDRITGTYCCRRNAQICNEYPVYKANHNAFVQRKSANTMPNCLCFVEHKLFSMKKNVTYFLKFSSGICTSCQIYYHKM